MVYPSSLRKRAYVEYRTRPRTRWGYVAANCAHIGPPSETPMSAARSEPTASITARTSSIRVSMVGI